MRGLGFMIPKIPAGPIASLTKGNSVACNGNRQMNPPWPSGSELVIRNLLEACGLRTQADYGPLLASAGGSSSWSSNSKYSLIDMTVASQLTDYGPLRASACSPYATASRNACDYTSNEERAQSLSLSVNEEIGEKRYVEKGFGFLSAPVRREEGLQEKLSGDPIRYQEMLTCADDQTPMEKLLRDHSHWGTPRPGLVHCPEQNRNPAMHTSWSNNSREVQDRRLVRFEKCTPSSSETISPKPVAEPEWVAAISSDSQVLSPTLSSKPVDDGAMNRQSQNWGKSLQGAKRQRPSVYGSPELRATEFGAPSTFRTATDREGDQANRPKRKARRVSKGDPHDENQRMAHIAVERNRRKQMNDHIATLKSLMPSSRIHKTDQASIVGSAVEFVKELEATLQSLQAMLSKRQLDHAETQQTLGSSWEQFTIQGPTYPTPCATSACKSADLGTSSSNERNPNSMVSQLLPGKFPPGNGYVELKAESQSLAACVEVKILGNDATVNIITYWRPRQLVKVIETLETLQLTVLHTNVTTEKSTILYTFNATVELACRMTVNQVAAALQETFDHMHTLNSIGGQY